MEVRSTKTSLFLLTLLLFLFCGEGAAHRECWCSNYPKDLVQCDKSTCDLLLSNGMWIGNLSGKIVVAHCLPGYCYWHNGSAPYIKISNIDATTYSTDHLERIICSPMNRRGVVCGECLNASYGPAVNSDIIWPCVSCSDDDNMLNWLYYILAIYVPLVLMFLLILIFDIRLTTGPVNAFIIFGQVVISTPFTTNHALPASVDMNHLAPEQKAYIIPYSVLNLNILGNILPYFCLSSHLNTLDIITLNLMEASTPLILILLVTIVLKILECFNCNIACHFCPKKRISFVYSFAAFIILSYSRFCDIASRLLDPVHTWDENGTVFEVRVYQDGEYRYNDQEYIYHYKAIACAITVILCVMPLMLLQYPLHWLECVCAKTINCYPSLRIGTIQDVFQGCYEDNRRFFAGLYLMLRLLLIYSPLLTTLLDQYLMQQVTLVVFIMLLGILKPYKNKYYNYIDIMIFTMLLLIAVANMYQLALYSAYEKHSILVFALQQVLIWLPLICYVLYGAWQVIMLFKNSGWYQKGYSQVKAICLKDDEHWQLQNAAEDDRLMKCIDENSN